MDEVGFEPSWIILTFNRARTVIDSYLLNKEKAGMEPKELIWVDNGSEPDQRQMMDKVLGVDATCKVFNAQNLGVSPGYNRGYAMATGTHYCITGCDRIMPTNWLRIFKEHFEAIKNTGIISCYSHAPDKVQDRINDKGEQVINGKRIIHALPFEARILPAWLFKKIGYLHEGFTLYGHEDIPWGGRAMRCADEQGLIYYTLPNFIADHLGSEGAVPWNGGDWKSYHDFKQQQLKDPRGIELVGKLQEQGYPYYTPY